MAKSTKPCARWPGEEVLGLSLSRAWPDILERDLDAVIQEWSP